MSFNKNSRLDPSQVEDRRGRRGGGTAIAVGGGGLGLIITIIYVLLGGNLSAVTGNGGQDPAATEYPGGINDLEAQCQTGADATPARTAGSLATSTASNRFGPMNLPSAGA